MRPRVAIDCRAATARMSGVGRYVVNLVEGLAASGEVGVLALAGQDLHPALAAMSGVEVVETGWTPAAAGHRARLAWEQRDLSRILARCRPDLVHATWNHGIPWRGAWPAPAVLTLHDLLPLDLAGQFGDRTQRLSFLASQYVALWRARRIVAVSHATRAALRRHAPLFHGKSVVIHEGVEDRFAPAPILSARRHLLYVGGREARKNLAGVFAGYAAADPALPLCLTGSADTLGATDAATLSALPARLRARIEFLGVVPDARMPDLYRDAALLIFPSRGEGFGFPPLEAMACGTPVIASRAGSIPEIAGEAALYVDPDDPAALGGAIARVLSDTALRGRMVAAGLERAAALRWPVCVARTLAVYRDVLRSG
jgi:glycosyltransferase involved in cell wall biosynthesis